MPALTPLYTDTPQGAVEIPTTARDLRAQTDMLQAGVIGSGDLKVTAAGSSVAVAPGVAYVSDGQSSPTLYRCEWIGTAGSVAIAANASSSPRVDQVIARVRDTNLDGGANRDWILDAVAGTAVTGATLDNRSGTAALPARSLRLADVLVPAGAANVSAGNIRDRRPWARGAYAATLGNGTGVLGVALTTPFQLTQFDTRLECSGAPLEIEIQGRLRAQLQGTAATLVALADGAETPTAGVGRVSTVASTPDFADNVSIRVTLNPTPGSHVFSIGIFTSSTNSYAYLENSGTARPRFRVAEVLRANATNG